MAETVDSGISYQPQYDDKGQNIGLNTYRQSDPTSDPNTAPVVSGNVDLSKMKPTPVTVHYPSGHAVVFPSEAHANEHAASVWNQLKQHIQNWQNWQGFEGLAGEDRTGAFGQSIIDKVGQWRNDINSTLEEAGANLGRLPAELISGAKNFQAMMPSPYGQKPAMESVEETAKREHPVLSGIGEAGGRVTGTLLTPENVAIMAAMPYAKAYPLLSKGLQYGFAAGMSKGVLDGAEQAIANWPKMTQQQKVAALSSGALQSLLAGLATIHAVVSESGFGDLKALKGESGEMKIPGTGRDVVGTAKGAEDDTRYFREAKAENPDKTLSDWMRIAQDKKIAAAAESKPPVRQLTDEDKAAAAGVPDINDRGQKLGVKPINVSEGKLPVVDKTGHPDYNEKGQLLGIKPDVEDIGGKVRAQIPSLPRETGERRARVRTAQEVADTQYFRQAVSELGQDATNEEVDAKIAELKANRVTPPSSANHALFNLLKSEEGYMRIPFTGDGDQGELFPGGEVKPADDEERVPIWYSHANETIANKVQDNMSGEQVRGILINNGVTPDEMHATGLNDYLKDIGKGKVSKAGLEQHMQENQIRMHDLNYGKMERDPAIARKAELHKKLGLEKEERERQVFRDVDNSLAIRHPDSFLDESPDRQRAILDQTSAQGVENLRRYLNVLQARLDVAQDTTGLEVRPNPEETEHANGRLTYDIVDPRNEHVRFTGGIQAVEQYLAEEINGDPQGKYTNNAAKWPQWIIGKQWSNQGGLGATDYTEKLMMLPESNKLEKAHADAKAKLQAYDKSLQAKYSDETVFWQNELTPEEKEERFRLDTAEELARKAKVNQVHKHSHWSDESAKNVVAFARYGRLPQFTDRPTMMLHEFQSDWNTDIKHSGYIGEIDELNNKIADLTLQKEEASKSRVENAFLSTDEQKQLSKAQNKVDEFKARLKAGEKLTPEEKDAFREVQKQAKELIPNAGGPTFSEADQKDLDSAVARRDFLNEERAAKPNLKEPVPNAPLVNNWVEVGAKRMLREMVDNGFTRMVWPTGEAAADLYGVHTHIKEIRFNPSGTIDLVDHSGRTSPQQNIPTTVQGLMEKLELPRDQAEKFSKQIENFKSDEAKLDKEWSDKHGVKEEVDENDDRPTEDEYRRMAYDQWSEYYTVNESTGDPTYEIWHDGQFIESYDGSEYSYRDAKKAMREWWEEKYPDHNIETGEYTGELAEDDENRPSDMEAPELREEEGATEYRVEDNDGNTLETFESESRADRYRDRLIDEGVESDIRNADEDAYKPDAPEIPDRPVTPASKWPKLEGMDLHFGGKLHRLLYDEMLPRFLSKYLKQWGAKVSKIAVSGAAPPSYQYQGPEISAEDLSKLTAADYDPGIGDAAETWYDEERNMLVRITDTMRGTHKSFSQVVNDMQEEPHFDRSYEQRTQREFKVPLSIYQQEAVKKIAERVGGKIKKLPGKKEFWQIETTPQMERALKTKPQRISQMAAPRVANLQQEQTA